MLTSLVFLLCKVGKCDPNTPPTNLTVTTIVVVGVVCVSAASLLLQIQRLVSAVCDSENCWFGSVRCNKHSGQNTQTKNEKWHYSSAYRCKSQSQYRFCPTSTLLDGRLWFAFQLDPCKNDVQQSRAIIIIIITSISFLPACLSYSMLHKHSTRVDWF